MAKAKRLAAGTRRKTAARRTNPTRTYASAARKAAPKTTYRRRSTKAKNPLIIYRKSRKNPAHSSEVLDFVGAGLGIGTAQPFVASVAGRFGIPGQWVTPVSTAGTGVGLYYLFGMFRPLKRFSLPALLLGVSTAIVSLIAPWIRRMIMPMAPAAAAANGVSGIGIFNGQPGRLQAARPVATMPAKKVAAAGPSGIGVWQTPAGRFGRR